MPQQLLDSLLSDYDLAQLTGFSVHTIRRWRLLKQGPRYIKIGSSVRYRPEDVTSWLESGPTSGGQQGEGAL